jgi:hypothetical protein
LQQQDNQIIQKANDLFAGIREESQSQSKRISNSTVQILAIKTSNQAIRNGFGVLSKRIDQGIKTLPAITDSLKEVPSKRELRQHAEQMEDQVQQMEDVDTDLKTAMEGYKFSESTPPKPGRFLPAQNPLGVGSSNIHPSRRYQFDESSNSSLRDTQSASTWLGRIRGGAGDGAGAAAIAGDGARGAGNGVGNGA